MSFIPIDKIKQLREAAAKGDERAKKILRAHLNGSDYASDMDAFFAPKPEPKPVEGTHSMPAIEPGPMPESVSTGNPQLDEWLRSNGIHDTDEDYEEALEEYFAEYPEQRPEEPLKRRMLGASETVDVTKAIAQGIIEVISCCDKANIEIMQNDGIDATSKKGAMTILQEIKTSLLDSAEKLTKVKDTLCKKEEPSSIEK